MATSWRPSPWKAEDGPNPAEFYVTIGVYLGGSYCQPKGGEGPVSPLYPPTPRHECSYPAVHSPIQ